jgi:hypothetical protein
LAKRARKQIMVFAPEFSDSVKSTMVYNNFKKTVECAYISIPLYGDKPKAMLRKIAEISQAYLFD